MQTKTRKKIEFLHSELKENCFLIPESWLPWLDLIELFLQIVYIFVPAKFKKMIDIILKAIKEHTKDHKS